MYKIGETGNKLLLMLFFYAQFFFHTRSASCYRQCSAEAFLAISRFEDVHALVVSVLSPVCVYVIKSYNTKQ